MRILHEDGHDDDVDDGVYNDDEDDDVDDDDNDDDDTNDGNENKSTQISEQRREPAHLSHAHMASSPESNSGHIDGKRGLKTLHQASPFATDKQKTSLILKKPILLFPGAIRNN